MVALPFNERTLRIPGTALGVGGSSVIKNAAVRGPRKRPFREKAETGGVGLVAPRTGLLHRIHFFGFVVVVAGENPDAAGGRPVGFEGRVPGDQLLVLHGVAVQRPAESAQIRLTVDAVIHVRLQNLIGARTAFLAVELTKLFPDQHHHFEVALTFSRGFYGLFTPLNPATGIVDGTDLFVDEGRGKEVDLGLDFFGLHVRCAPEKARFRLEPVGDQEPIEFCHGVTRVLRVRRGMRGIHAPAHIALNLVVAHVVKGHDGGEIPVVLLRSDFREQVVAIVVFEGGVVTEPFLQGRYPEFGLIGVIPRGVGFGREVFGKRRMRFRRRPGKIPGGLVGACSNVGRPLDVRFAAQRIDAAARDTDVA